MYSVVDACGELVQTVRTLEKRKGKMMKIYMYVCTFYYKKIIHLEQKFSVNANVRVWALTDVEDVKKNKANTYKSRARLTD